MTQVENLNDGNHSAAVAEMSLLDQYFVGLGSQVHPDGLPTLTAGDWSV